MLPKSVAGIGVQLIVGHQAVANGAQHIEILAVAVATGIGIGVGIAITIAIAVAVAIAVGVAIAAAAAALVAVAAARRPIIVRTDQWGSGRERGRESTVRESRGGGEREFKSCLEFFIIIPNESERGREIYITNNHQYLLHIAHVSLVLLLCVRQVGALAACSLVVHLQHVGGQALGARRLVIAEQANKGLCVRVEVALEAPLVRPGPRAVAAGEALLPLRLQQARVPIARVSIVTATAART